MEKIDEVTEAAQDYAGQMIWIDKGLGLDDVKPEHRRHMFHEYISEKSFKAGAEWTIKRISEIPKDKEYTISESIAFLDGFHQGTLMEQEIIKNGYKTQVGKSEISDGTHFWATMSGKLVMMCKCVRGFYVCGAWEISVHPTEFEVIQIVPLPSAFVGDDLYYL